VTEFNTALLIANVYRYLLIVAGVCFGFMGYRLFIRGIYGEGDLQAGWGDYKILLKRVAPGTFFAVFGVTVIAIAIWRPVSLERYPQASTGEPGRVSAIQIPLPVATILSKAIEGQYLSDDERTTARKWLTINSAVASAPAMRIEGHNPVKEIKEKKMYPVRENEQPKGPTR